eukprot:2586269-Amphidinium_carterae.1
MRFPSFPWPFFKLKFKRSISYHTSKAIPHADKAAPKRRIQNVTGKQIHILMATQVTCSKFRLVCVDIYYAANSIS